MSTNQKQTVNTAVGNGPEMALDQTALYAAMQVSVVEDTNFRYTCFAQVGTPAFVTDDGRWQVMREDLQGGFTGRIMFPRNANGTVTNGFAFNLRANAGVDAVIADLAALTYSFENA